MAKLVWKDGLVTHWTYLIGPILNYVIWFGIGMEEMKNQGPEIGRWMGVVHTCGSALNYFILTDRGRVVTCDTLQHPKTTGVQNP